MLISILIFLLQHSVEAGHCSHERRCLTCPVGHPFHCTSCENGFVLKRAGAYLSCEPCPAGCIECGNSYKCNRCASGHYGIYCQNVCGIGCINSTCDQYLGVCGCKKDFSGRNCDRCINGKYGYEFNDCKVNCPSNCKICLSDKNCSLCNDGYYGLTCEKMCSKGCHSGTCLQDNGTCVGYRCKPHFKGLKCNTCTTGRHGRDCASICPENCVSCSSVTSCILCKDGYWGAACQSNCSGGCYNETCSKENGICTDNICKTGYTGDKCDNCITGHRGANCNVNETLAENESSTIIHIKTSQMSPFVIVLLLCVKEHIST